MAEQKTKPTGASVKDFIAAVSDEERRKDCQTLLKMMKQVTGVPPRMWGPSMVGFGEYHYKYASGHEGDCFRIGFAPRKQDLTLYLMGGFESVAPLMKKLGKHKCGKSCLYIKRLSDVDLKVLADLLERANRLVQTPKEASVARGGRQA